MKYLKRYNEELHLNPLQFGKLKVNLVGGTTIYVEKNKPLSEENKKIIIDDCLKAINRDLGSGWKFEKIVGGELPPYWSNAIKFLFSKGKYNVLIVINDKGLSDLKEPKYDYYYKIDIEIPGQYIGKRNIQTEIDLRDYLSENGLYVGNGKYLKVMALSHELPLTSGGYYVYSKKFRELRNVNIDENHLNKLINNFKQEVYTLKSEEDKDQKEKEHFIDYFTENYPKLKEEITDIVQDLMDFTSFSEIGWLDIKDDLPILFDKSILRIDLYWEKLGKNEGVSMIANNLDDWDYLNELSKIFKQIDARIRYLNEEYFESKKYKLSFEVDTRNNWGVIINLEPK